MAILLVDDNELNLELQKQMLERYALEVVTASGGREAVELARRNRYELILMDIQMPEMDGLAAAKEIRKFDWETPIVSISAQEITDLEELSAAGINGAVVKPLEMHKLREAVENHIQLTEPNTIRWKRKTDVLFDFDSLCDTIGGVSAALNVIRSFLFNHGRDGNDVLEAIDQDDYARAGVILHDIVSTSGLMNCHRLYNSAFKLNVNVKSHSKEGVDYFHAAWLDTVSILSDICERLGTDTVGRGSSRGEDDPKDWETLLSNFRSLAGDFDVEATELLFRNEEIFRQNMPEELFRQLSQQAYRFNYIQVQELMEGYHV